MDQQLSERVVSVIARTQKIPHETIRLDSSLEELGIDSFDGVNILFALEDEFDIRIPDEAKELKTIRDIVENMEEFLKKPQ
jgi:acyl carrier protein